MPPVALAGVTVGAASPARASATYEAICGLSAEAGHAPDGLPVARFRVAHATVVLVPTPDAGGVREIVFRARDLAGAYARLEQAGLAPSAVGADCRVDGSRLNGVPVCLVDDGEPPVPSDGAPAALDHVAVAVADLDRSVTCWRSLLGVESASRGPHPLGTFDAARFLLGPTMIELVSPRPGVPSAVSSRLDRAGEGVITVAVVPGNLDAALARVRAAGARLVESPPHWMVHPADACGVLVQLTPRLQH